MRGDEDAPEVAPEEEHEAPVSSEDDARAATPEGAVSEELRDAFGSMREEADRIAALDTGQEQVEAAERFAEDAGRLDEGVGSAARAVDDDRG